MNEPSVLATLGPNVERAEVPGAARAYLKLARAFLAELHASGASGRVVNEAHSDLIDRLIRRLFELSEEQYFDAGGESASEFCVVAVGGYARREMSLHSDVDLLFLFRDSVTPYVKSVAERLQLWLWDSQVIVGGSTRTVADALRLAREDKTICTSLLAPRFLAGSGVLFHQFSRAIQTRLVDKPWDFIADLVTTLHARHAEYGESLYLLQPNLKEGAGGLRDYHTSYWAMQVAQPSSRSRDEFLHQGLLTENEMRNYVGALDFLWRTRNELHLVSGRKHDQMSFDLQEKLAGDFGYEGKSGEGYSELPVERFMRDYYRHARNVLNCSSLVLEQCLARVSQRPRRQKVQYVEEGLRITGGQLEIPHARHFRDDPLLLLRVFAIAQRHDVPMTRKARRLVREHLDLVDEEFVRSPDARDLFLGILRGERRVTRSLTVMNEVGLLARYLPEWDHIVCRWQQVMYHTYTVDVHSIFLVEELRRLWKGDYEKELPDLTELVRGVEDLAPLFLGCLFHDIGKGLGGNHSPKGAVRARACLERMGADAELVDTVGFLVDEHLIMSHIGQRRDLSDPKLILDFARLVGNRARLRLLYLLTVADIRASSRKAWTEWKGRLLKELFERTSELLETGAEDPTRAIEIIERRADMRREGAAAELRRQGVTEEEIDAFFAMMPHRYLTAHTPTQIARHAQVALQRDMERAFTHGLREMRGGFTELILVTRDVHGLFSNVAGVITAHHLNILGAHVYTTSSGLALEVYRVVTPAGDERAREMVWRDLLASLERVLSGRDGVEELLRRRGRPLAPASALARRPAVVEINNDESDFYTIADVTANDRLGLLHDLTRVIAQHGYEIYISKAGRVLDQVADTFYLKDGEGRKLYDEAALRSLREDLLDAARTGGDRAGRS